MQVTTQSSKEFRVFKELFTEGVTIKGDNLGEVSELYKVIKKANKDNLKINVKKDDNLVSIFLKGESIPAGSQNDDRVKSNKKLFDEFNKRFKKESKEIELQDYDYSIKNAETAEIFVVLP